MLEAREKKQKEVPTGGRAESAPPQSREARAGGDGEFSRATIQARETKTRRRMRDEGDSSTEEQNKGTKEKR